MNVAEPKFRYEQVTDDLRRRIASGQLTPGEQLPPENLLAEEYGITRQTLRRALELLAEDGVILRQKGRGTFVADTEEDERIAPVLYVGEYEAHFFRELYLAISREGQRAGRPVSAFDPRAPHSVSELKDRLRQLARQEGRLICVGEVWERVRPAVPPELPPPVVVHVMDSVCTARTYHISVDRWRATHIATEHLIHLGHRNLAFLGTHPDHDIARGFARPLHGSETYQGFSSAVQRHRVGEKGALGYYTTPEGGAGLPESVRPWAYCPAEEDAERLVHRFLDDVGPEVTGFVCDADFRAVTLCHALAARGQSIPEDVSVIGVGCTPWSEALRPMLSSVNVGELAIARLAVQCATLPSPDEAIVYFASPRVVARGSTGAVRAVCQC